MNDAAREELNRERAQILSRPDYLDRDVLVARVSVIDNLLHRAAGFIPVQPVPVFTLFLSIPFPPVILNKSGSQRGSLHASTIVTGGDEDEKETMRIWFKNALARTTHFILEKPEDDERQASASRAFVDYKAAIEGIQLEGGLKVWDIQKTIGHTISVVLEDSTGLQKELTGRADFIISSHAARCQGAALQNAVCVVEIQSNDSDIDCEFQLVTYLVMMMNRFGLRKVAGILVYKNGTCRSYRASRDGDDAVYQQNDTFGLYQIADVLPLLLNFSSGADGTFLGTTPVALAPPLITTTFS